MSFGNKRKERFIATIPVCSLDSSTDKLTAKCKFNFAYFEKQAAGQDFHEWPEGKLHKFLNKLKEYSGESLKYWTSAGGFEWFALYLRGFPNSEI